MLENTYYTFYERKGNNILIRYKEGDSKDTKTRVFKDYKPSLYVSGHDEDAKSIYDDSLSRIEFDNISAAKDFADQYKDIDNFVLEGNSNYGNQFVIELFDGKPPEYNAENIKIGIIDIEVDADGEFPKPEEAKWPINAITIYNSSEHKFYTYVLKHSPDCIWDQTKSDERVKDLDIQVKLFDTEEDLLRETLKHYIEHDYDITSGWYSESFDYPYLINRCHQFFGEAFVKKCMSPFNDIKIRKIRNDFGEDAEKYDVIGVPHLDFMVMYKKHVMDPRERYTLDYIASVDLGENKISYEESQSLHELYREDFQKFVDYNIQDVNLIVRLDAKRKLFDLTYAMAYYSLSNYDDTLGTVKIWEQLIAKFLYTKGVVPPFNRKHVEKRDYAGGYVKKPIAGKHEWIVSYDLNSLYPHAEQQWNIGIETHIPYEELPLELKKLKEHYTFDDILNKKIDLSVLEGYNYSMAANFEFYDNSKMSFFSEIKRDLYAQRTVYKKKMLEANRNKLKAKEDGDNKLAQYYSMIEFAAHSMQLGLKLLLNGGYGALGNKNFLYYKVENAEAITLSCQLVNKWTTSKVNKFLQDIFESPEEFHLYGDTDSGYFTVKPFVGTLNINDINEKVDTVDRFCKEVITPKIETVCQELCDYMCCFEQRMVWAREVISDKGIFFTGKKKYVLSVLDSEGSRYTEPYIKTIGVESVKTSFPQWSRDYLKECYTIGLYETESDLQRRVSEIEKEFYSMSTNDIAIPTSVNGIDKYYESATTFKKGAQKHVRGAIIHNTLLDKLNIKTIKPIGNGSKIKYIGLKMPNPIGFDVIGFNTFLPKEFIDEYNIEKYINKKEIFEKSFLAPLRIFLSVLGWSEEEKIDLFSF